MDSKFCALYRGSGRFGAGKCTIAVSGRSCHCPSAGRSSGFTPRPGRTKLVSAPRFGRKVVVGDELIRRVDVAVGIRRLDAYVLRFGVLQRVLVEVPAGRAGGLLPDPDGVSPDPVVAVSVDARQRPVGGRTVLEDTERPVVGREKDVGDDLVLRVFIGVARVRSAVGGVARDRGASETNGRGSSP